MELNTLTLGISIIVKKVFILLVVASLHRDVSISPYFKLLISHLQLKRSVLNDIRWDPHRFQIRQSDDQRTMIYSQVIRNPKVL